MPWTAWSMFSARLRLGKESWSSVIPTAPTCAVLIRDDFYSAFLPPDLHNWAFLLMLGVLGQEIQSGGKKTNHRKFLCSTLPTTAIFNAYLYPNITA